MSSALAATMNRDEIEREADRLISGKQKTGLREHVLAWLLYTFGQPLDVRCPRCHGTLIVTPFADGEGANVARDCGTCSGAMRGL